MFDVSNLLGVDPNGLWGTGLNAAVNGQDLGSSLFDYIGKNYGKQNQPSFTQRTPNVGQTYSDYSGMLKQDQPVQSKETPTLFPPLTSIQGAPKVPNPYGIYDASGGMPFNVPTANQSMNSLSDSGNSQIGGSGFDAQKFGSALSMLGII